MLKKPFISVLPPMVVPLKNTLLKGTGSPFALSYTKPFTVPKVWAPEKKVQKLRKNKTGMNLINVYAGNARKSIKLNEWLSRICLNGLKGRLNGVNQKRTHITSNKVD